MPLIRRWQRMSFVAQLVTLASVLLVTVGALVVALVAIISASHAGSQAKNAVGCVNSVLGDRNGPTAKDAAAHIAFAQADKRFSDALADVLILPNGSQAQRDAYDRFVIAARRKKLADDTYVKVLVDDQRTRNSQPLGRC